MWDLSMMVWRIGELLDVREQIEWVRKSGFEGIGFHASSGVEGEWRGIAPGACVGASRDELRELLRSFSFREIHAPFSDILGRGCFESVLARLAGTVEFAGDVGGEVVTLHAEIPGDADRCSSWRRALKSLDACCGRAGVKAGLEITSGFAALRRFGLEHVGVTLDVGHMYLGGGVHLRPFGGIRGVVDATGEALLHLHIHDVLPDGTDHVRPGAGIVDFAGLLAGLHERGYGGGMCLELNPARVTPEEIKRSRAWLVRQANREDAQGRPFDAGTEAGVGRHSGAERVP